MVKSDVDVAVVGAGAAGIGAGLRLADAGLDILLLEARDRVGGRALTVTRGASGALDLGCGWLHSGDVNAWTSVAEARGIAVDRSTPPWRKAPLPASMSAADNADFQRASEAFHERLAILASGPADPPVSEALDASDRWTPLLEAVSTYVSGAEPLKLSARDLAAYADSGVNWRLPDGYGALIAGCAAPLPVALDCPVRAIDRRGARLKLETARGDVAARAVIVAIPSALIAEDAIAFEPPLPEKAEAARGLPLGLADKLYLALDGAEAFEPDTRVFGRTDTAATAAYALRPLGRPVIECYFGGALADDLEREGDWAFFDHARTELGGVFGGAFKARLRAEPMHLWRSDPYSRGSYSYATPGHAGDRARLAAPVDDRLFFAGEACSARSFSTAHGAYETGVAAAEQAIAALARAG